MYLEVPQAFRAGRAIKHGLEAFKRQPFGLLIGSFLLLLTNGGSGSGGGNLGDTSNMSSDQAAAMAGIALVAVGCGVCLGVIFWLFRSWLQPGYFRLHRQIIVEGQAPVGVLFSGGNAFGRMALWKLLKGVIGLGVAVVALSPSALIIGAAAYFEADMTLPGVLAGLLGLLALILLIYVQLGLVLGDRAVALDDLSPVAALDKSWSLARGARGTLLWYFIVTGLFNLLGLLMCCVGVFFTSAFVEAGTTEAYLLCTRDDCGSYKLIQDMGDI